MLEMTEFAYKTSFLCPTLQLLLIPGALSDFIVKVMKALHDISEANINHLTSYYLHCKEKPEMTKSIYKTFLFRPPLKLLLLLNPSFDCIVKFATHNLH